jgi:hypothetical protein
LLFLLLYTDFHLQNSPSGFVEDAYSFDIPSRLLRKLSKQYSAEAARQEKLQCMEDDVKRKNIELTENRTSRCDPRAGSSQNIGGHVG